MAQINIRKERENIEKSNTLESDHINRRKFIKELGIAGAGALSLLRSNAVAQNVAVEIKTGLIFS